MHAPTKTSIIYTSPQDSENHLQTFCQSLKTVFSDAGLLAKDERPLLLHATLVNTIYVPGVRGKGGKEGHGKRYFSSSLLFPL